MVVAEVRVGHGLGQLRVWQGRLAEAGIGAGLVEGERVKRGEHTHVGQHRGVVARVAVARGRHVAHYGYVERRAPVYHRLGVFGHAAVKLLHCGIVGERNGIEVAGSNAPPATHAVVCHDVHLACRLVEAEAVVGAFGLAAAASAALLRVYLWLAVAVLVLFPGARAAAHANVLYRSAEARHLVALEVGQRYEHVGIHHGAPYLGLLHVFASGYRHGHVVGAFQPVANYHRAAHGERREAVLPGAVEVVDGVLAAAGV